MRLIKRRDFFEAIGFRHYAGSPFVDDMALQKINIDRIYDTYIDENQLRACDLTLSKIADELEPKPYSSREFIYEMGRYLEKLKVIVEYLLPFHNLEYLSFL